MANRRAVNDILRVMQSEYRARDADLPHYREACRLHLENVDIPERTKSNMQSIVQRQVGDHFYRNGNYDAALEIYNKSICYAEVGSEQSAVYFEMGEYGYALNNIALARQQNCPERLLPKLESREARCKEKSGNCQPSGTDPDGKSFEINVAVNPRIPFLASGIAMDQSGVGLVAQQDFQTGDVILVEKPVMVTIGEDLKYRNCKHCGKRNLYSLIPCPTCVQCMYCSADCLEEDKKFTHRFECDFSTKLERVYSRTSTLGARLFLYGLTLFEDDLQAMMQYCNSRITNADRNPFTLDYTELDVLKKQFKQLHKTEAPDRLPPTFLQLTIGVMYYLICMQHPLLQSIAANNSLRNFMCSCMLRYSRSLIHLRTDLGFLQITGGERVNRLYSFTCLITHAPYPNVFIASCSGTPETVVTRPIRKGEQIVASSGFQCNCTVCSLQRCCY